MWCGVASHVRLDGHEGDVAASFRPLDVLDDLYQVQRREAGFADVLPDVAALFEDVHRRRRLDLELPGERLRLLATVALELEEGVVGVDRAQLLKLRLEHRAGAAVRRRRHEA